MTLLCVLTWVSCLSSIRLLGHTEGVRVSRTEYCEPTNQVVSLGVRPSECLMSFQTLIGSISSQCARRPRCEHSGHAPSVTRPCQNASRRASETLSSFLGGCENGVTRNITPNDFHKAITMDHLCSCMHHSLCTAALSFVRWSAILSVDWIQSDMLQ